MASSHRYLAPAQLLASGPFTTSNGFILCFWALGKFAAAEAEQAQFCKRISLASASPGLEHSRQGLVKSRLPDMQQSRGCTVIGASQSADNHNSICTCRALVS